MLAWFIIWSRLEIYSHLVFVLLLHFCRFYHIKSESDGKDDVSDGNENIREFRPVPAIHNRQVDEKKSNKNKISKDMFFSAIYIAHTPEEEIQERGSEGILILHKMNKLIVELIRYHIPYLKLRFSVIRRNNFQFPILNFNWMIKWFNF